MRAARQKEELGAGVSSCPPAESFQYSFLSLFCLGLMLYSRRPSSFLTAGQTYKFQIEAAGSRIAPLGG